MKRTLIILIMMALILSIYPLDEVFSNNNYSRNDERSRNRQSKEEQLPEDKNTGKSEDNSSRELTPGPIERGEEGEKIIANPDRELVLVNKERALPADYVPDSLVIPDIPFTFKEDLPKKYVREKAAKALESLFAQVEKEGIKLAGVSGYRSYSRQQDIFAYKVRQNGEKAARKTSAPPGHSEHQTGLAIDVSSPSVNYSLASEFGQTEEGKWLARNAPEHGFIIRYPEGKQELTGYQYEPWHIRYVGREHALYITRNDLILEEYLAGR